MKKLLTDIYIYIYKYKEKGGSSYLLESPMIECGVRDI